jgi:hypothetical protein
MRVRGLNNVQRERDPRTEALRSINRVRAASWRAACAAFCAVHELFGRTAAIVINCRRALHRFDSATSVTTCAVF